MRLCHVPTYQPIGLELQLTNDNLGPNRAFVRRHVHLHKQHMVEHENGKKIFAIPQKSNKYQREKYSKLDNERFKKYADKINKVIT